MQQRGITRSQIDAIIRQKNVTEGPYRDVHGRWNCRFEGYSAGDGIVVVLGYYEHNGIKVAVVTRFEIRG